MRTPRRTGAQLVLRDVRPDTNPGPHRALRDERVHVNPGPGAIAAHDVEVGVGPCRGEAGETLDEGRDVPSIEEGPDVENPLAWLTGAATGGWPRAGAGRHPERDGFDTRRRHTQAPDDLHVGRTPIA